MTTKELKQYTNKVLGNNLRCLLPSYWWKRLFNLVLDKIEEKAPIVGSLKELNGLNLPMGSIASVANDGTALWKSISDCYQASISDINILLSSSAEQSMIDAVISKLDQIQGIKFRTPIAELPSEIVHIAFFLPMDGQSSPYIIRIRFGVDVGVQISFTILGESENWVNALNDNGGIDAELLFELQSILASKNTYYLYTYNDMLPVTPPDTLDSLIEVGIKQQKASDVYVKGVTWEKLAKESDISQDVTEPTKDFIYVPDVGASLSSEDIEHNIGVDLSKIIKVKVVKTDGTYDENEPRVISVGPDNCTYFLNNTLSKATISSSGIVRVQGLGSLYHGN